MKLYIIALLIVSCMAISAHGQTSPTQQVTTTPDLMQFGEIWAPSSADAKTQVFSRVYTTNPWNLNAGAGERHFEKWVNFSRPFSKVPYVLVTLSGVDYGPGLNKKNIHVTAPAVYCDGFFLDIATWADSTVDSAYVTWIAIPCDMGLYNK